MQRTVRFVIWTILMFSPLPREWAQPTTDMLMGFWGGGLSFHPANRESTHAG